NPYANINFPLYFQDNSSQFKPNISRFHQNILFVRQSIKEDKMMYVIFLYFYLLKDLLIHLLWVQGDPVIFSPHTLK
ncbi:MAG: hypothetical protein KBF71_08395, partial [Alphaproteobacteria bacterium]|nr:hypothetical protein [Alphaproteobacteria bacterium]